ncbi:MAG: valine--tRNA ligase [Verrucomicrobia bacterium]|nr:valine--tRNA ligase [Verrucomicrobiota bacterium]
MSSWPKAYDPKEVEEKWYSFWEEGNYFKADAHSDKPPFTIVIPPPNVTGVLHMGHALVDTLEDILIRWKRMLGFEALWVPGTDHAGIATQTVVERNLFAKTGKRRKDFSREEFLEHVWAWKNQSEGRILHQLRKLGCSCDWSRLRFTMDETSNQAVRTCFKKMFDDGLIYRGDYLVNWDPVALTALSDDEVEHEERESSLWHIKYPLTDGKRSIVIATTRPETMLGDVAVAVHPSDERYKDYIGQEILLPLANRKIPIIADPFVEPTFGSGAVKITPAHDFTDFEVGNRHDLPRINILTPDAKMNERTGRYEGLGVEEARAEVVADLKKQGFLVRIEPHKLRVGVSYRSKAVLQPYLSKQWFVKMSAFKEKLISAVRDGRVKLIPPHWESTYFHWIENLRDWCISRQLWWGHQIPIWYGHGKILCYDGVGVPPEVEKDPAGWTQDQDVLDTWFSSALWPFSVMGWPEKTADLKKFYPTSVLITGHDILFFWVARMILMGEYTQHKPPFHETFLHGLIYGKSYWRENQDGTIAYLSAEEKKQYDLGAPIPKDVHSKWEKMSKSKGNIIDPIELIEDYGTDAMRMALCSSVTHARQIDLDRRRFEEFKNFANKVWNGARFVFMNLEDLTSFGDGLDANLLTLEDKWILSVLNRTVKEIHQCLTDYTFDKAATRAYEFFWNDFCAVYVELAKPVLFGKVGDPATRANKQKLLAILLSNAVRLLHPITPFITEELFTRLKEHFPNIHASSKADPYTRETIRAFQSPACIKAPYPEAIGEADPEIEKTFEKMNELVRAVRNIRAEMQIPPSEKTDLTIIGHGPEAEMAREHLSILSALTPTRSIEFSHKETSTFGATAIVGSLKLFIPMPESLKEKERLRLEKEREKLLKSIESTQAKLANQEFRSKAPKEVVEKLEQALSQGERQMSEIARKLTSLT